jgi:hypothetical protein
MEGQIPETYVFENQADISTGAEYDWYEWVKYCVPEVNFPDTKVQLGLDLGPAINSGLKLA